MVFIKIFNEFFYWGIEISCLFVLNYEFKCFINKEIFEKKMYNFKINFGTIVSENSEHTLY